MTETKAEKDPQGLGNAMKSLWFVCFTYLGVAGASAHVNDRGMNYESYRNREGMSCCNEQDCKPVQDFNEEVVEGQPVVRMLLDGIWITVSRSYVVNDFSTDGRAHFCGQLDVTANPPKPEPICIILPSPPS